MPRLLLCAALLIALPLSARAEPKITSNEMLIQLTVQPMAAPKPALRYLLLPELKELNPGNPIPNYLRCVLENPNLSDPEALGSAALRQADWAARLDQPDWQILLRVKTDGIGLLLPDVQKIRAIANGLRVRFRAETNLRHFDDALRTARTLFAMSKHLEGHPTLIGQLVGVAIATIALVQLEEMLEQPGCPNLYWALTNLPAPFISMEKGLQGERALIFSELRDLDDGAPLTAEQLAKLIVHFDKLRDFDDAKPKGNLRAWLDERIKDAGRVEAARRRLVEYGIGQDLVKQFPPEQVILLDERRGYEEHRDELMKLMNLPTWEAEAQAAQLKPIQEPSLFDFFLPALLKVRRAQGRLEQRIALLRHVEALRLYAAEHDGKLPENLSDVKLPLPVDPFTGKPFRYTLQGRTAHLRGTPPVGLEKEAVYNVHYEITIQK